MRQRIWVAAIVALIWGGTALAEDHGFLYGTVITEWGDEYTGRIRWDKNEGFWDDVLDATKEDDDRYRARRRRGKRITILGIQIYSDDGWDVSFNSSSQLRFGHIASIEPRSRGRARVRLKNGEKVYFEDAGSDLGSGNRGIIVDDEDEGIIELEWRDVEKVEFRAEPNSYTPNEDRIVRLYGTVTTETDETFTGFIVWDADEIYSTDILDGEDRDRDREIPFARIASIERRGRGGSDVVLTSGRELRLSGSNDVDDGHRGVVVNLPNMGRVDIDWEDFEKVVFAKAPRGLQPKYDDFDGGTRLVATVTDDLDETYTGEIAWDNDEKYSWEFLNGKIDDIDYDIEFSLIRSIERLSRRGCKVTLTDGTVLKLRGSNDVDEDNKGIFIETADGDLEELDWDDFELIVFKN
jgi:hypothetical protein